MNDKISEAINTQPISLIAWLCLIFCKTYCSRDKEGVYESVVYAKKCFGKIYIMKIEEYKENTLVKVTELTRK